MTTYSYKKVGKLQDGASYRGLTTEEKHWLDDFNRQYYGDPNRKRAMNEDFLAADEHEIIKFWQRMEKKRSLSRRQKVRCNQYTLDDYVSIQRSAIDDVMVEAIDSQLEVAIAAKQLIRETMIYLLFLNLIHGLRIA